MTAMLYPTVTELTRGTAHPESQASQTVLVALSVGRESPAEQAGRVRETAASRRDLRRLPGAPVRLGRRGEVSGAGHRRSYASDPGRWRGVRAA